MTFELPSLPYPKNALEPHVSAETFEYHHGKHHQAYVTKLNKLVEGSPKANQGLEEIIRSSEGGLFNQAAQVWNHTFFWNSMSPDGGGDPKGDVAAMIDRDLGGADAFRKAFKEAAIGEFGSGWTWLIQDAGKLKVISTHDADTPIAHGQTPLLTCDVWEHAYYIDYRNDRARFIDAFLENLVNWEHVARNLSTTG